VLLRANAARPERTGAQEVGRKQPRARGSSNSHLHIALAIAIAAALAVIVVVPFARTQASQRDAVPSLPAAGDSSEWLRAQAVILPGALAAAESEAGRSGLSPSSAETRTRAVAFTIHEDGFSAAYNTQQVTVGKALARAGIEVGEGDLVSPVPGSELTPGAHVYIHHAVPIRLVVAGKEQTIRTRGKTVTDALLQAGVGLEPTDWVSPGRRLSVRSGMTIKITTVRNVIEVTESPIAYSSSVEYDSELNDGVRLISQGGLDGWIRREYRVRQINGRETRRVLVSEAVTPATNEVVTIGTYVKPAPAVVVAGAVAAPEGDLGCSRTLNVYATWYTAASAGGSGVTATGTGVYKGIVAVDPRVIPLGTRMYIPGYGYGLAADTGSGVIGNHIDLGYGADDVKDWRTHWVDICIL